MFTSNKLLLITILVTIAIWVVFFLYFGYQSRRHFNVNFVPLSEFYIALGASCIVWIGYLIIK